MSGAIEETIYTIIPAAGASRRLGFPKQLVPMNGESLLRRATRCAIEARLGPVVVVLGCEADRLRPELQNFDCFVLTIDDWQEGMSASIRAGAAHVSRDASASAALVMLVDQWALTSADLTRLAAAWQERPSSIAAAEYADGTVGVPAVFSRDRFDQLTRLTGDAGARYLLRAAGANVVRVAMPNAEADFDHSGRNEL